MPLSRVSAEEALSLLQKNIRRSAWPDGRKPTTRLGRIAEAVPTPTFSFDKGDRITTIGSCFAREIERHLDALSFDLPMLKIDVPAHERISGTPNDVLNKYSVHSMENEIRWAFEGLPLPQEQLFLEAADGLWIDPHLGYNLPPVSFERVSARRQDVMAAMRDLASSKVVIITLGLAESWFHLETELYLNGVPHPDARKRHPGRFALDVLGYDDIIQSLGRIHGLVKAYGHPEAKILITTSPVPFKATLTGDDALVANSYSKCVQRAACGEFVSKFSNVNYFPSYEIVTLTDRSYAYTEDNIHINRDVVGFIMDTVLSAYCPTLGVKPKQKERDEFAPGVKNGSALEKLAAKVKTVSVEKRINLAGIYFARGEYAKAVVVYSSLLPREKGEMSDEQIGSLYTDYGVTLLRLNQPIKGVEILETALFYCKNDARLNFKLGIGWARCGHDKRALQFLEEAVRLDPSHAELNWRLGAQYMRHNRHADAEKMIRRALEVDPKHKAALKTLDVIQNYKSAA